MSVKIHTQIDDDDAHICERSPRCVLTEACMTYERATKALFNDKVQPYTHIYCVWLDASLRVRSERVLDVDRSLMVEA